MMRKKVEHDARYFNITALQRELQQQRQLEWGDGGNTRRNSTGAGVEGERRGNGITVGSGAAAGLRRSNYTNSSDCTHISAVGDIASPSDATAIGAASDTPVAGGGPSAVVAEAAVGARADIAMASGPGMYSQLEITIGGGKLGLSFEKNVWRRRHGVSKMLWCDGITDGSSIWSDVTETFLVTVW